MEYDVQGNFTFFKIQTFLLISHIHLVYFTIQVNREADSYSILPMNDLEICHIEVCYLVLLR